ncbi:FMN-binding protein [Kribbella sp. NPDC051718]|uniref:FMN-binding protein n=1 Tax=Kribbella sp. NPDC051718 TaxID=3155168 RepID=UPI003413630C
MRAGHLRRNSIVLGATTAVLGLLFLYPTSTNRVGGPAAPAASAGIVTTAPAGRGGRATTVVNGESALTRYGPVQVQVTISSSRISAVKTLASPSSGDRDRAISAFALPILQREAVTAQSATIDTVSGATFTSDGYRRSLQSALDTAHFTK